MQTSTSAPRPPNRQAAMIPALILLALVGSQAASLDRTKRATTFSCTDEQTRIKTPFLYKPTSTHKCGDMISGIADLYDIDYRTQCQFWQGLSGIPDHIEGASVSSCLQLDNGMTEYRADVCCTGATTGQRCFTTDNCPAVYRDGLGYHTETCNYQGSVQTCSTGQVCMTNGTYETSRSGKWTKQCVSKEFCDKIMQQQKCQSYVAHPSCAYCCDTPYCNFHHTIPYLVPGERAVCDPSPCAYGGTCVEDANSSTGYKCTCPPYSFGPTCSSDICSTTKPCQNGGFCRTQRTAAPYYSCDCRAAWRGDNCTIASNLCSTNPCKNGGSCYDRRGYGQRCHCPEGWVGARCETPRPLKCPVQGNHMVYAYEYKLTSTHNCSSLLAYTETSQKGLGMVYCPFEMQRRYGNPLFKEGVNGHIAEADAISLESCEKGDSLLFYNYSVCCPACSSNPCQNGGWCQQTEDDGFKCKCRYGYGGDRCQTKQATCYSSGDPHFSSFDGSMAHFQGGCKYLMSGTVQGTSLTAFKIFAKHEYRDNVKTVTYTKYVDIVFGDFRVRLGKKKAITVNGVATNPGSTYPGFALLLNGRFVRLETDFGLVVESDGDWLVIVKIPDEYFEQVEGLCADFNGDPNNDLFTKDGVDVSNETDKYSLFGGSWQVPDPTNPKCLSVIGDPEPCDDELLIEVSAPDKCGLITDVSSGDNPFEQCIKDPRSMATSLFDGCVYDVCANQHGDMHKATCKSLEVFAARCLDLGYLLAWREKANCTLACPAGSDYLYKTSACPATCSDPHGPSQCGIPDTEGCVCPHGYLLQDDECIEAAQCGCLLDNGIRYKIGSDWLSSDCSTKYTCTQCEDCSPVGGKISVSETNGCDEGYQCALSDEGQYTCEQVDCMDDNGVLHEAGSVWVSSDCSTEYTCNGIISSTTRTPCAQNERCELKENTYTCVIDGCVDDGGNDYEFGVSWLSSDCSVRYTCLTTGHIESKQADGCHSDEICELNEESLYVCVQQTCVDELGVTRHVGDVWVSSNCSTRFECTLDAVQSTDLPECQVNEQCALISVDVYGCVPDSCADSNGNKYEFGSHWLSSDCTVKYICTDDGTITTQSTEACQHNELCERKIGMYACVEKNCRDPMGGIREVGDEWYSSDCTKFYMCTVRGILTTNLTACARNQHCQARDGGVYACVTDRCMDDAGTLYAFGSSWLSADCAALYRCHSDGAIVTKEAGCAATEHCKLHDNLYVCVHITCLDENRKLRAFGEEWTSANCQYRLTCTKTGVKESPTYGCGHLEQCEQTANIGQCVKVVGTWSSWSEWSDCSGRCHSGEQRRSRVCEPTGYDCGDGQAEQTRVCQCTNTVEASDCDDCEMVSSELGYLADPCHCKNFIQCQLVANQWILHPQRCGECTEWNQTIVTCDHIPGCQGTGDGGGSGPVTVNGDICELDGTKKKMEGRRNYQQLVHGSWVNMPCGSGTTFRLEKCTCVHGGDLPDELFNPRVVTCLDFSTNFLGSNGAWTINEGASLATVQFGDTAYFDGYSRVEIPRFINGYAMKKFSVSLWYQRTGTGEQAQGLITNGDCVQTASIEILSDSMSSVGGRVVTTGGEATISGIESISGTWHHVVMVYDGDKLHIYVDNVLHTSVANVSGTIGQRHCPLMLGTGGSGMGFTGYMDKVCFYRNALPASYVTGLYNEGVTRTPPEAY